eukprot:m.495721 g.495721  ORF g.495721 m.495721 type:complete len:55 (-) comp21802_c2_seq8:50-214(-)
MYGIGALTGAMFRTNCSLAADVRIRVAMVSLLDVSKYNTPFTIRNWEFVDLTRD